MNKQRLNKLASDVLTSDLSTDDRRFLARFLESLSHTCGDAPQKHFTLRDMYVENGTEHLYVREQYADHLEIKCAKLTILNESYKTGLDGELNAHLVTKKELASTRQQVGAMTQEIRSLEIQLSAQHRHEQHKASNDELPDIEKRFIRTVKPLMTVAQFDLALKLFHLIHFVPPELQDEARELLCGVSST